VQSQQQATVLIEAVVKQVENLILKVSVKINDHISAENKVELNIENIMVLYKVMLAVIYFFAEIIVYLDDVF